VESSPQTDEQLAEEAGREGSDGPAFLELLQRYRDRIWRVCYRLMGNTDDANDAAQEVCVRLFVHRGRFAGRSKYSTWVHGVTVRTCLGLRRGRGRSRRRVVVVPESALIQHPSPSPDPAATLDLDRMLSMLGDEDRALIVMKYAEEHSYEELSEIFELSPSACKMRVSRALQRIRERFSDGSQT